jgi:hypothetical protein
MRDRRVVQVIAWVVIIGLVLGLVGSVLTLFQ